MPILPDTASDHVRLQSPPLKRMIVQLRFPPELGFDAQIVRPLHKALASDYPKATSEQIVVGVSVSVAPESEVRSPVPVEFKRLFRFATLNNGTEIHLTDDYVALETTEYDRFSALLGRWERVVGTVVEKLEIQTQVRLGLRYTNIIERDDIHSVEDWTGLIEEHLLVAVLENHRLLRGSSPSNRQEIRFQTSHGGYTLNHGFPALAGVTDQLPQGYVIDIDAYDDSQTSIDIEQQIRLLTEWNHQIYRILRRSVTDNLWKSFRPEVE